MALPGNAEVVVVRGFWWDEATQQGMRQTSGQPATVTFTPVPLDGQPVTDTPNLRDLAVSGFLKTRSRIAVVDRATGYFATQLIASNDPDLDAYAGRLVTFLGEPSFIVEVPYNAPTVTVDAQMAAAVGLPPGSNVKAVWLSDAALVATPAPPAPINYLSSSETLANIASAIEDHDGYTGSHPDIRAIIAAHTSDHTNPHQVTKAQVGLGSADNTSDVNKPVSTAQQTALDTKAQGLAPTAVKTANYTAAPADLVPVDASGASRTVTLPTTPADRTRVAVKMIATSGSNTVTIACGGSDVLNKTGGSTSGTLSVLNQAVGLQYASASGIWYIVSDDIPLSAITKAQVGLGNADNTSDVNKPVSTAQQTALNFKIDKASNLSDLASAATSRTNLGLGNVDNTSDVNKPVSTATSTALAGKANTSHTHTVTDLATTSGTASSSTFLRGDNTWAKPRGTTATNGDVAATLTPGTSATTQVWNTALTAARAVTLAAGTDGDYFRVVRTANATGAFNLNVGTGPLKALTAASTWVDVTCVGTTWFVTAAGSL